MATDDDKPFVFPASSLDDPGALLTQLGSLWETTYQGGDFIADLCAARLALQRQVFADGRELVAAISRLSVPVHHLENWLPLPLLESAMNAVDYTLAKFGDGTQIFAASTPHRFGVPDGDAPLFAWPLPAGWVDAPALFNRITLPSVTLTLDVDYTIRDGFIIFRENPFDNPLMPQSSVFESGDVVDWQVELFAFKVKLDQQLPYRQFGYALGVGPGSGQAYKDLVNALYDSLVLGSTAGVLQSAWSAVTGIPLVQGTETVEEVIFAADRTLVVTSANVYAYDPSAVVTVAEGDVVHKGDTLTDALRFYEFNRGQCPSNDQLMALTLGKGFLSAGFFADLVFENVETGLTQSHDADGFTMLSWRIGGFPGDVTAFFEQLHARGRATGVTLAHLMDLRPAANRDSEPTGGALPATINPMKFLCQHVLRDNAFVVKLRTSAAGNGVGVNAAKFLRRVVPPQTAMIVVVELEYADDPITMDGPGDENKPGYVENVLSFLGMTTGDTIDPAVMVSESVRLYQIGGRCA